MPQSLKSLVVIASRYPCNAHPTWHVFTRQIAHSFARQGVEVTVICPLSIHRAWRGRDPFRSTEDAGGGATVSVFRPRFLSMSSKKIGRWSTFQWTVRGTRRAVQRVICRHMPKRPDALYGHFMYPAGAVAVSLGTEMAIPSFPAAGEGPLDTVDRMGKEQARRELRGATAFIANSTYLARLMHRELGLETDRVGVFPNGVNRRVFFPRDRSAMRRKYGLPPDLFLVGFVGNFEARKGPRRLADAIRNMDGVAGVFVGDGPEQPEGENVLLSGRLRHEQVPEILSACDVFALPTIIEGSCNAILEAMACGLPVVSSTGTFNDDILNGQVAIRVDPLDVAAIRAALLRLRDNPGARDAMSRAALDWSAGFDIDRRAKRLLEFMAKRSEDRLERRQPVEAASGAGRLQPPS
jgi:glycosyltransferase involved in cell wall biosynthesis